MSDSNLLNFDVEQLEKRQMLSTVQVIASGSTGQENFDLEVAGQIVGSFTNVSTNSVPENERTYTYETDEHVTADQIRILFTNDAGAGTPQDRNLTIDKILVDGAVYETENVNTLSIGTWRPEDNITPGNGRGDTLHANGFIRYSSAGRSFDGSEFVVRARGISGQELMRVTVNGFELGEFRVTNTDADYTLGFTRQINPANDIVRVEFTNDGAGRDLIVDNIRVDGTTFQSEASTTFSTGSFTAAGLVPGFSQTEYLHGNGYFQYNATNAAASTINVFASGLGAQFRVTVNGIQVGRTANVNNSGGVIPYAFQLDRTFDQARDVLRVEFLNDGINFLGENIDLRIDRIEAGRTTLQTEAASTFSTGTWDAGGLSPGVKRSEILHSNGYFEYNSPQSFSSTISAQVAGTTGTEQFRFVINGQQVGQVQTATTALQDYSVQLGRGLNQQTDIVRVEFLNDGTENGVNRNLVVNMLTASYNTTPTTFGLIPTSVPNTFTTANFSPLAVTGFTSSNATDGQSGNVLHTNGYVEYFLPIVNNNPTPPVESQFKIELVNEGTISAGGFAIIEQAATFLESVVVGDVRGATDLTI